MSATSAAVTTSRDPVCGADVPVAGSPYSTVYHQITVHFCSDQCRARFLEIPALYTGAQRTADIRPMPKRRTLRIAAGSPEALMHAAGRVAAMVGVSSALAGKGTLRVEYDLRQVALSQIEAVVACAGVSLKGGLHELRRSLWKFFEHNELENAAHAGTMACCSRPPGPR